MRKVIFIVLIVVVAALVAFFCWREILIPDVNYVADYVQDDEGDNNLKIQRLYAADVDVDKYEKALELITNTTEYSEEEKLAAAIASGEPVFFPTFNIDIYRLGIDEVRLSGVISYEMAENQKEERFRMGSISLEAITQGGIEIDQIETITTDSDDADIIKIHTEQQMAIDISKSPSFEIILKGAAGTDLSGSITLQFTYSVEADIFIPRTVLEEQLLEVSADISMNAFGNLEVEYIVSEESNRNDDN